ncbi:DUF4149 domain-containing protein [Polaromonas sp.]|uniref:DUF4149 domain-containing protein n=1 Tax=Polaromonas sp. TaxID=1869339 RepID=UPI0017EE9CE1|nr:DUF4149 domain-containing protein [Polaromonas sp.]
MLTQLSDLIVAGNVGILLLFTVAVAPTIFMAWPAQWATAYMRKFFPKYFYFWALQRQLLLRCRARRWARLLRRCTMQAAG